MHDKKVGPPEAAEGRPHFQRQQLPAAGPAGTLSLPRRNAPPEPKPSFLGCNSRCIKETMTVAILANHAPKGSFVMEEEDFEITRSSSQ